MIRFRRLVELRKIRSRFFLLPGLVLLVAVVTVAPVRGGVIYVSQGGNSVNGTITRIDIATNVATTFASSAALQNPHGLAFDASGNLYVASSDGGPIMRFTPSGVGSVFANTQAGSIGLAFDGSGNLYATGSNFVNAITRFTPGGVGSIFATSGLNVPFGLAFDGTGNLYAANILSSTIVRLSPAGVDSVFANAGLNFPIGLAFDGSGNLYAANNRDNTIERFTPSGIRSVFANSGLNNPYGLTFDDSGNLYVANAGDNTIERFTPGGVGSVFATLPGLQVHFLAFQPTSAVPEPSSLLTFSLGLIALLGHTVWRRRTTQSLPAEIIG